MFAHLPDKRTADNLVMLVPGDRDAQKIGFTREDFEASSYLSVDTSRHEVWASFIWSRHEGRGNVRRLFLGVLRHGYRLLVPAPSARMQVICQGLGMKSDMTYGVPAMHIGPPRHRWNDDRCVHCGLMRRKVTNKILMAIVNHPPYDVYVHQRKWLYSWNDFNSGQFLRPGCIDQEQLS